MTAAEENYKDYKKAETRALEILSEMRKASPKTVDIELALLVSIFELHKGTVPPATTARIVQGHLETLVPFYSGDSGKPAGS